MIKTLRLALLCTFRIPLEQVNLPPFWEMTYLHLSRANRWTPDRQNINPVSFPEEQKKILFHSIPFTKRMGRHSFNASEPLALVLMLMVVSLCTCCVRANYHHSRSLSKATSRFLDHRTMTEFRYDRPKNGGKWV